MRKLKARRRHADNSVGEAIECYFLSQDILLAAKTALPETVAQHNHRWRSEVRRHIFRLNQTSHQRFGADHRKQVCRHDRSRNAFRLSNLSERQVTLRIGRYLIEAFTSRLVIEVLSCFGAQMFNVEF